MTNLTLIFTILATIANSVAIIILTNAMRRLK